MELPRARGGVVRHWLGNVAYRIVPAKSPDFLSILKQVIQQESIDAMFFGTDAELPILSRHRQRFGKPWIGARSIGVQIVNDRQRLDIICREHVDEVFQELLSDAQGEFTAGCIMLKGRCRAIVNIRTAGESRFCRPATR